MPPPNPPISPSLLNAIMIHRVAVEHADSKLVTTSPPDQGRRDTIALTSVVLAQQAAHDVARKGKQDVGFKLSSQLYYLGSFAIC
jgi:hypothetical protein